MLLRVLVIVLGLIACFIPVPAAWVERLYSRGLYAWLQPAVTGISNRVPFAILDIVLVGGAVIFVAATAQAIARTWRSRRISPLARFAFNLLVSAALIYLAFLGMWGLNYRREPISDRLASNDAQPAPAVVTRLGQDVARQLNQLHDRAHREGFAGWGRIQPALAPGFVALQELLTPGTRPRPGVPKWSILSYFFTRAGVSGMTDPFFLEVLVDRELLPFERPFVVAHEWAHLAGYADEAEANFVGWLACVRGSAPAAYSGWLYLYAQTLTAVPRGERPALVRALGPGPRADLTAVAERARRIHPVLQSVSWQVYDRYLKANRVEGGVASYDRALLLVLRTRFVDGWTPVVK